MTNEPENSEPPANAVRCGDLLCDGQNHDPSLHRQSGAEQGAEPVGYYNPDCNSAVCRRMGGCVGPAKWRNFHKAYSVGVWRGLMCDRAAAYTREQNFVVTDALPGQELRVGCFLDGAEPAGRQASDGTQASSHSDQGEAQPPAK